MPRRGPFGISSVVGSQAGLLDLQLMVEARPGVRTADEQRPAARRGLAQREAPNSTEPTARRLERQARFIEIARGPPTGLQGRGRHATGP